LGSGTIIPKRNVRQKEENRQGVYVTRESAGNVVERAVVMTLRRAEVTREEHVFLCRKKKQKNVELFQVGAIH